jgi:PIN domain nuclease of toxin-antitoxin system
METTQTTIASPEVRASVAPIMMWINAVAETWGRIGKDFRDGGGLKAHILRKTLATIEEAVATAINFLENLEEVEIPSPGDRLLIRAVQGQLLAVVTLDRDALRAYVAAAISRHAWPAMIEMRAAGLRPEFAEAVEEALPQ